MSEKLNLFTRNGVPIKKISEIEYKVEIDSKKGMLVPVIIYANEILISKMLTDRTIDQAINVAHLPGVQKNVLVLPDGHEGYGFPIGGVAATDTKSGVISPGGVGYDINCGVRLIRTNISKKEIEPKLKELLKELYNKVPSGLGSKGKLHLKQGQLEEVLVKGVKWAVENGYGWEKDMEYCEENGNIEGANPTKVSDLAKKRGAPQLGSLGSGNHFLEIQTVNQIVDKEAAKKFRIDELDQIVILIHTGSRGFGYQVCSDYLKIVETAMNKYNIKLPDRELASAPNNSEEAQNYLDAMKCALNFAWSNRQMITHWIRQSFEKVLKYSESDLEMNLVYDVAHNIAKLEKHRINDENKEVIVHRKGATRSFPPGNESIPSSYREYGQPVLIPGSMGTASWVLLGSEKAMDLSFGSTAHGAGRMMSRSRARKDYPAEIVKYKLNKKGILIESASWRGISEEAPGAYKDVDIVVDVSDKIGIGTKVVRLTPIGVVKG